MPQEPKRLHFGIRESAQTSLQGGVHEASIAEIAKATQAGTGVISYIDAHIWVIDAVSQTAVWVRTNRTDVVPAGWIFSKYSAILQQ